MKYYLLIEEFGGLSYGIVEDELYAPKGSDLFDDESKFQQKLKQAEKESTRILEEEIKRNEEILDRINDEVKDKINKN